MNRAIRGQGLFLLGATSFVLASHGGALQLVDRRAALPETVALSSITAEPIVADTIDLHTEGPNLSFSPERISAKNGTQLTIRYTNDGVLPHNFVLLKDEDDLDTVGPAAFDAEGTGYVPLEHKDKFIAYSELAKPGTTVEVTFTVPEPGEYTFACLYPGHYNVMLGTLRSLR